VGLGNPNSKIINRIRTCCIPPPDQINPTDALDTYPPPNSEPTFTALSTATILDSPEPESTVMPEPPPGWPTDQPWPPARTKNSPTPTIPPSPFPTTAVLQASEGNLLDSLQQLWFPYFPKPDAELKLWAVGLDEQHRQWENSELPVDIFIPILKQGFDPGPILTDIHISPDLKWLVADYAYRGSLLVNLSTSSIIYDSSISPWRFFDWIPNNQGVLIFSDQQFKILDPTSLALQAIEVIDFGENQSLGKLSWYAIAYSPDGKMRADAIVYPAFFGIRDFDLVEIGLWDSESNQREPLAQVQGGNSGGNYVVKDSLRWSPDSKRIAWVAHLPGNSGKYENQLWIADLLTGNSRVLDTLGIPVEYNQPAIWSPDGKFIAALRTEDVKDEKVITNNIYLIDLETGENRQLTFFSKRKLSHLQWSPNGKWLTFTISMGDYGEIWAVDMETNQQFPIAGPTFPDAPFSWVP